MCVYIYIIYMCVYICVYIHKFMEWICIVRIIKGREKTPNNMMFETATPQNYLNQIVEGESQAQWELSAWFHLRWWFVITTLGKCLLISYDFLTYSVLSLCFLHVGNPMPSPLGDGWNPNHLGHFDLPCAWRRVFHGSLVAAQGPSLSEISPIRIVALNTHGHGGMLGRFLVLSAAEGIGRMGACAHTAAVGGEIWSLHSRRSCNKTHPDRTSNFRTEILKEGIC